MFSSWLLGEELEKGKKKAIGSTLSLRSGKFSSSVYLYSDC